jgi:hypothetical protein
MLFWLIFIFQWPVQTEPFVHVDAEWFLLYLSAEEFLIPGLAQPSTVFFLLSLANFLEHWHVWLMPALLHRGEPVTYVQLSILTKY